MSADGRLRALERRWPARASPAVEGGVWDFSALSLEEQFDLDQLLAVVESGGALAGEDARRFERLAARVRREGSGTVNETANGATGRERAAEAEKKRQAQAEADRKARVKAERDALEEGMRRRFLAAGGTEAEWLATGPRMVAAAIAERAESESERVRAAAWEMARRTF